MSKEKIENKSKIQGQLLLHSIYIISVEVKLSDYHHFDGLVEAAQNSQALLISIPVKATDALLADVSLVKQLHFSDHSSLLSLTVLDASLRRIVIFVQVQCSVSTQSYKYISVLRQMLDSPECSFLCGFSEGSIACGRVEGSHIKYCEFSLESGCTQFVHHDVFAVEFDTTHSVFEIGVPNEHLLFQVEELDISVIIACSHHSLLVVVRVTKTTSTYLYLTVQQSGSTSDPQAGSSDMTGAFWRGSQIRTEPSLPPVTISQGPYP